MEEARKKRGSRRRMIIGAESEDLSERVREVRLKKQERSEGLCMGLVKNPTQT